MGAQIPQPIFQAEALCARVGRIALLDDLNLVLRAGEVVAVIGESGSGKSLLGRAIAGLVPRGVGLSGTMQMDGCTLPPPGCSRWAALWGSHIAHLRQDARAALNPLTPIGAQVQAVLVRHQGRKAAAMAVARLMEAGLPADMISARPDALSGGQSQLAALACVLATPARLVIADEPTSALDGPAAAHVMALMRARATAGAAVVVMTHDLALAAGADRLVVLHAGQICEDRSTDQALIHPGHPYTVALLGANPAHADRLDALRPLAGGLPDLTAADVPACRFVDRCVHAMAQCRDVRPRMRAGIACHRLLGLK